jgi:hypothetical protein
LLLEDEPDVNLTLKVGVEGYYGEERSMKVIDKEQLR